MVRLGKSTSVFTKEQNSRRDRVRSCLVGQERNTYLTVCSSLFNLKDCTVGHTGTGASLLRSAKRFWTLDLYCFLFGKVASSVVEGRTPWIYSGECQETTRGNLLLTSDHLLQFSAPSWRG